jgi:ribonuclease HI
VTRRPGDVQDGPGFFEEEVRAPIRSSRRLIVEADGGSRGNPGPSAYGALVRDADTGEVVASEGQTLGVTTNNVAEYSGLIAGLEMARAIDPGAAVEVRMDSKLVIEQMAGRWKIKHESMKPLALRANKLRPSQVSWTWVPRAENKAADSLVNAALDGFPTVRP